MYQWHVFLDFEMNPIPRQFKKERNLVRSELIEIGAVKLNAGYELVDRYAAYVRPVYGPITAQITQLTGITDEAVAAAPEFAQALERFSDWIGTEKTRLYSWSMSDWKQLSGECRLKGVELPPGLRHRWMDFQRVYTRLVGLSSQNPLSLKNAIGAAETTFDGQAHRAVQDAENSASLLTLVETGDFAERTRILRESLHPTTGYTISDSAGGSALAALLEKMKAEEG
mgnify:CR=1 FL=1